MENDKNISMHIQAERQLKYLKGFYNHLFWYFIINSIILVMIYMNTEIKEDFWRFETFWLALSWGLAIPFYALWVFWRKPLYKKVLDIFNLSVTESVNWQKVLFYANLTAYIIIIPLLVYINYRVNQWELPWFVFSMIGWGIGIIFHAMKTFNWNPFFGNEWEKRKLKQFLEEKNNIKT